MDAPSFTVDGNRLTPLERGPARFDTLIALIDGARASLRILYYIYADDGAGRRMNDALLAAAKRGVRVRLIIDGFGSDDTGDAFFQPLRDAGVDLCRFSARFGRRYLLRNHQKLALADGDAAAEARIIIGGFNVEDDYFSGIDDGGWRDLGLLVEGAAAARMTEYFDALDDWIRAPRSKVRHLNKRLTDFSETDGPLRWLIGGPTRRLSPWARRLRADMRDADTIDVIAGYFTPSPTMLRRLDKAGRRGGKVRVVTARRSDNNATIAAARFTYAGLLRKGVRIFEYLPSKLHTKLYAVGTVTHIGSANFDMRSLFINLELMLRIDDAAFSRHVHDYVDGEVARSEEITPAVHKRRAGIVQRVKQLGAYLLIAVVDPNVSRGLNFGIDD